MPSWYKEKAQRGQAACSRAPSLHTLCKHARPRELAPVHPLPPQAGTRALSLCPEPQPLCPEGDLLSSQADGSSAFPSGPGDVSYKMC